MSGTRRLANLQHRQGGDPDVSSSDEDTVVLMDHNPAFDSPTTPGIPLSLPPKKVFTLFELFGLFAVSFSYAFCFNTLNNVVIPKEIERLTTSRQSMWVGLIMAAGAVSQLATPIVGSWSDHAGGQRIPFLIYGTLIVIIGVVIFLVLGMFSEMFILVIAHIVTTIGLSIQYSMVTALLNDYVSEEQTGKGSGAMAILAILGSGMGYALFAMDVPLHYSYCSYILASIFCLGICVVYIPPVSQAPISNGSSGSLNNGVSNLGSSFAKRKEKVHRGCCGTVIQSLSMPSPSRYPDFFFACLGRALFNTGLAGQVYLVYYLRDVLEADRPVQVSSMVAVMALLGGIVGALPSGIISDRVGKKPVIYGSIAVCVGSFALFMLVNSISIVQMVGFVYGVGNVAYLSVDYALGVQALPRKKATDHDGNHGLPAVPIDAAKDLGVFAMSATAGQLFGQVLYGAVLDQYGTMTSTGTRYSKFGFLAIYTLGAVCFLGTGVATFFIRGVK